MRLRRSNESSHHLAGDDTSQVAIVEGLRSRSERSEVGQYSRCRTSSEAACSLSETSAARGRLCGDETGGLLDDEQAGVRLRGDEPGEVDRVMHMEMKTHLCTKQ